MKKIIITVFSTLLGVAMFFLYLPACEFIDFYSWTQSKVNRSVVEGDKIVITIERFKNDQGKFPDKLELLVPQYLSSLPKPYVPPYKWEYKIKDGEYTLSVNIGYPYCTYYSKSSKWYSDGIPWNW